MSPDETQVTRALRTIRATAYRVRTGADEVSVALVMRASEAGRRTAAQRIVGLLAEHGMELATADPVAALLTEPDGVAVRAVLTE